MANNGELETKVETITITSNSESEDENGTVSENVELEDAGLAGGENAPGSDAVTIARIEAERDTTIAAIEADIAQSRIELEAEQNQQSERDLGKEIEECRLEISEVKSQLTIVTEQLQSQLIPQPSPEEIAMEATEELAEAISETPVEPSSILTPTSTPIAEIETEVSVENEEEKVEVEAKAVRKFIPI